MNDSPLSPGWSWSNSLLPPAWSQWWWVVKTVVRLTFSALTASKTVLGSTGSTIPASFVSSSMIWNIISK